MLYVVTNYPDKDIHTIKKENSYLAISTPQLKFLDISSYLAAGSSYSQFLKAYGCEIPKGIFPYEWFDSFDKLAYTSLSEMEDFYSTLSNSNSLRSEQDYLKLKEIWSSQGVVENDGVSTSPLDMVLCPWDNEVELIEKNQSSLSNIFLLK